MRVNITCLLYKVMRMRSIVVDHTVRCGCMQMNILGNVKEPFLGEDRFEVTFTMSPPRYGFHLFITGRLYVCDRSTMRCSVSVSDNFIFTSYFITLVYSNNRIMSSVTESQSCKNICRPIRSNMV